MHLKSMKTIRFDKFFVLLEKLVPMASGFVVCDAKGMVVATHGDPFDVSVSEYLHAGHCGHSDVNILMGPGDRVLLRQDISSSAGNLIGTLLGCMGSELSLEDCCAIDTFAGPLGAAAACIASEYELIAELDSMAQELTGRYEELNLVYEANDDIVEYNNEADTINKLLQNCVEYLDVSLVALVSPREEKLHFAVSTTETIKDPYLLVQHFSKALYARVSADQACLIINELSDQQRKSLSLDIPYKVLTCPVLDNQGSTVANLVCLNRLSMPDFFNSDKNLLDVMSRKLSKIILANHDVMTGLINLRAFTHVLQDAIDTAYKKGVSHVYLNIDLDQLSVINDTLGRAAGDDAIKTVAELLKNTVRSTDVISYLGEGRFGIVMEMCTHERGMKIAQNICRGVAEAPFSAGQGNVELSVSIGIALVGPDAISTDAVFEAAELAREVAKKSGRNQVRVYRDDSRELAERKEQMQWVSRIQKTMRDNRFHIYCQEIRPTGATSEKYHFEILIRMIGEDGELIPPDVFIPTAERYNIMPALDRWVIDNTFALLQANSLAQHPGEGIVSINLSGQSLADEGLTEYVGEMLYKHRLLPNCICFEITETTAFGNIQSARKIIDGVREIGCHFSLDDFGTGLSSFSYLKDLPVDFLKIDGSFVRNILKDRISHAMVSSINQIGHVMGLKTVAEFVESEELTKQLELIGVDYLQGYAIGKPMPLQEYLEETGLAAVRRTG
jgi:diguanylate cyclase (GGDEF)-like protein